MPVQFILSDMLHFSPSRKVAVALILSCLALVDRSSSLKVEAPAPLLVLNTPKFELGLTTFEVTAKLTAVDDVCDESPRPDLQGRFILSDGPHCSYESAIRACQAHACAGVIVRVQYTVAGYRAHGMFDGTDRSDLAVPLVEITEDDSDLLLTHLSNHPNMSITLTDLDTNEWTELFDSSGFLLLFQFLLFLPQVVAALICWQTLQFYYGNLQRTQLYGYVPIVALLLEMAGNLERAFYLIYDPFGARQRLTFLWSTVLVTVSAPWAFISTILVIFYWNEVLRESHLVFDSRIKFLPTLKKPFVVLSLGIVAEDLTFSILIGKFVLGPKVFRVVAAAYFVAVFFLTLLIIVYGYRIIQRFKRDYTETVERRRSASLELQSIHAGLGQAPLPVVPESKEDDKPVEPDKEAVSSILPSGAVGDRDGRRSSTYHVDLVADQAPAVQPKPATEMPVENADRTAQDQTVHHERPAQDDITPVSLPAPHSRDLPELSAAPAHGAEEAHAQVIVEVAASAIPVNGAPAGNHTPVTPVTPSPIISEHSGMPVKPAGMSRQLAAEKNLQAQTKAKVYRMTVRILVSAIGMILLMAVCLMFLVQPRFVFTPFGYFMAWWFCELSLIVTSFAQIITFYH